MKHIIYWDAGYGKSYEIIDDGSSKEEALEVAHANWEMEAQDSADYGVIEWTKENEELYCS